MALVDHGVERINRMVTCVFTRFAIGVGVIGMCAGDEVTWIHAQAHRPTHIHHIALVIHQCNHREWRVLIELGAVGLGAAQHMPGKLDAHDLHAQTQPQIRDVVFAGKLGGDHLAFDAAVAKSTRHHNAGHALQHLFALALLQIFAVDPMNLDVAAIGQRRVIERFAHTDIGVVQLDVFADNCDGDDRLGATDFRAHIAPAFQIDRLRAIQL